ncbi:MAG: response regulator [Rhodospirillum sp.]|nr:response regulator [Rhodospirillum sp.]MCF8491147.1 response regulator [Rhodospirillum sp.]MCF8502603.1 response regulator [Rhodospirillum sp.]
MDSSAENELLFAEEDQDDPPPSEADANPLDWKILIVDDDPEVHLITRTVLSKVRFKGRGLNLLSAHSAAEAKQVFAQHGDIAAILLDVVMESEDAGLRLVHYIREDLGNRATRIILRTGQPGQAPEREVIVNYDINDYKAKTELTAQKLFTTIVSALRAFDDILELETGREQLRLANAILEQRVADRTEELARSNTELEAFAYGISHDLQEPLRMVRGYLQLIRRRLGGALDKETGEYMEFAQDGANRMATMISDLLDYARISAQPTRFTALDLRGPLDRALANLSLSLTESGATVVKPDTPALVRGDEGQLGRLFQNLIGNALKYRASDHAPRVTISTEPSDINGRTAWSIAVADNGPGIAPEDAENVFTLFHRLDRETAGGTGVGLALCRRIVERHGGRIWLDSTPGQGATFHVLLPSA